MSRPEQVYDALRQWLDGPSGLNEAIHRTVEDGLFPEEDVLFAVAHLRESLTPAVLEQWWKRAGYGSGSESGLNSGSESESESESKFDPDRDPGRAPLKILCLHAGNLPLVGLQDVLAVLLSGKRYYGKISRKDPWLTASFLDVCRQADITEVEDTSTDLSRFRDLKADAVLFAGSAKSVPQVRGELDRLRAVHSGTKYLIRTAQTSVAYIERKDSADDLLEAVTRYRGRGCRSVSMVVSPFSLDQYPLSGNNDDLKNQSIRAQLYRIAYAEAVGIPYRRAGSWLFLETGNADQAGTAEPGVVLWIRGEEETVDAVGSVLAGRLQTVYNDSGREGFEPLNKAQRPEIDWKPDGSDTLQWLIERVGEE